MLRLIRHEVNNQLKKWGIQRHSAEHWLAILTEEVGEFARAILENKPADAVTELIQVAAVASSAVWSIARYGLAGSQE